MNAPPTYFKAGKISSEYMANIDLAIYFSKVFIWIFTYELIFFV